MAAERPSHEQDLLLGCRHHRPRSSPDDRPPAYETITDPTSHEQDLLLGCRLHWSRSPTDDRPPAYETVAGGGRVIVHDRRQRDVAPEAAAAAVAVQQRRPSSQVIVVTGDSTSSTPLVVKTSLDVPSSQQWSFVVVSTDEPPVPINHVLDSKSYLDLWHWPAWFSHLFGLRDFIMAGMM